MVLDIQIIKEMKLELYLIIYCFLTRAAKKIIVKTKTIVGAGALSRKKLI